MPKRIANIEEYFWSKADKISNPNGCWEWLASKNDLGYGFFGYKGKILLTHRLAYTFSNGEIPELMVIRHRCSNHSCINPEHLFLGTKADIVHDQVSKINSNRPAILTEKVCTKCGKLLNITQFYPNKKSGDGYKSRCKTCCKAETTRLYYKNIESRKAYRENYYHKNIEIIKMRRLETRDKYLERGRKYYAANLTLIKERRAVNKEKTSENRKKYYLLHKEAILERARKSRLEHPGRGVANNSKRRALLAGNSGSHTPGEIQYLKELQNYKCLMCGKREPEIRLTYDHILPVSKGGGDGIGNGQMLCKSCNSTKRAKFIDFRGVKPKRKTS